jgi:hypothetical protein
VFFEILQSHAGVDITAPHGIDAALLSTSERNNRAVAQLLVNDDSDDETDAEDEDADDKNEEEGDGDKKEEATTESSEAATLSAAADVTVGEVADQKEFPMMHKLNVSTESRQKIIELHKELLRYLQKTQPENNQLPENSFSYDNNGHSRLFFQVPKGASKKTLRKLQKTIKTMIMHCADDDEECLKSCATSVIGSLENEFKDSFLNVAKERGYSTSMAGKMSAEYWNAMAEAANLRTNQQIQTRLYIDTYK